MQQQDKRAAARRVVASILEQMRPIEGWLLDAEATLLIATVIQAIKSAPESSAVIEIGSYCGKSTVVLGGALSTTPAGNVKIFAIDPHQGVVGALDRGLQHMTPTFDKFRQNISKAGIAHLVEIVRKRSFEVQWSQPICLLFIDGLHDYASVARDFNHFESFVAPGGFVAFHDYADHFPGVKTFVDEVLAGGLYERVRCVLSLIVIRKRQ